MNAAVPHSARDAQPTSPAIREIAWILQGEFCVTSGASLVCEIHDEVAVDGRCPRALEAAKAFAFREQTLRDKLAAKILAQHPDAASASPVTYRSALARAAAVVRGEV